MTAWVSKNDTPSLVPASKIMIIKKKSQVIGLSPVYDYMFHSAALEKMDLFTWISHCMRIKSKSKSAQQKDIDDEGLLTEDGELSELDEDGIKIELDESKSNTLMFTSEHPLFATHAT